MKKQKTAILLAISLLLLAIVSVILFRPIVIDPNTSLFNRSERTSQLDRRNNMNMGGDIVTALVAADQEAKALALPPLLEGTSAADGSIAYTITAQEGSTQIKEGSLTQTYGYNGSFLGPVIRIRTGQKVTIKTENNLDADTSFHWHGLKVPSNVDGGPHSPIAPGKSAELEFTVKQEAATLWFHPHPVGETGEQVYGGLAGLIYIEDENANALSLPSEYGSNDFPIIVQDRLFDSNNQFDYDTAFNSDGITGDTLVVNGTINPYIDVKNEKIRLRLLNGSNARNYQFQLSDGSSFHQIGSDGGLLNAPVSMKSLQLVPGERAETIVDLSSYAKGETIQLMTGNVPVLTLNITAETADTAPSLPDTLNTIIRSTDTGNPDKELTFSGTGNMVTIDGKKFNMDRIDLKASVGSKEIWEISNTPDMMGSMIHPFHLHGVQFKVLSRNGAAPPANELGWKDTIALYPGERVQIEVEFPEKGIFMYHCHILEHEDNGMMGQILVE